MATISWDQYLEWLGPLAIDFKLPPTIPPQPSQFNRDSRSIKPGECYVAIKGSKHDGHQFINDAVEKGATSFIYQDINCINPDYLDRGIFVSDVIAALQRIGAGYLSTLKAKKIAITGSVGKTTCKQLAAGIFATVGHTTSSPASYNNEIGVPLTMLSAKPEDDYIVFECGARHLGDIKFLVELIKPDVSVVLNAGKAHIAEFGSEEMAIQAKTEMFRYAPKHSILIAPADHHEVLSAAHATGNKVLSFGYTEQASVRIKDMEWKSHGDLFVTYCTKDEFVTVKYNHGHEALAVNGAAAAAAAYVLGIDLKEVGIGLSCFKSGPGRFKIHRCANFVLIDDTYNANPTSMINGFLSCQMRYPKEKKVVVLGDMLELGSDSINAHRLIGSECYRILKPTFVVAVGNESQEILAGAIDEGHPKDKVLSYSNVEQALSLPPAVFKECDVIYLKGSNAINLKRIVDNLLHGRE